MSATKGRMTSFRHIIRKTLTTNLKPITTRKGTHARTTTSSKVYKKRAMTPKIK